MTAYEFGSFCGAFLITGLIRYMYMKWYTKNNNDPLVPNLLSIITCVLLYGAINTYKFGFVLSLFIGLNRYIWAQLVWLCIDCVRMYKNEIQSMIKYVAIAGLTTISFCCLKMYVIDYLSKNVVPDIISKATISCWTLAAEDFCKDSKYFPVNYIKILNTVNKINDLEYKEFKNSSRAFEQSCLRTAKQQYYNQQQYMSKDEICYDLDSITIYDVQNSQQTALSMFPIKAIKGMAKEILRN